MDVHAAKKAGKFGDLQDATSIERERDGPEGLLAVEHIFSSMKAPPLSEPETFNHCFMVFPISLNRVLHHLAHFFSLRFVAEVVDHNTEDGSIKLKGYDSFLSFLIWINLFTTASRQIAVEIQRASSGGHVLMSKIMQELKDFMANRIAKDKQFGLDQDFDSQLQQCESDMGSIDIQMDIQIDDDDTRGKIRETRSQAQTETPKEMRRSRSLSPSARKNADAGNVDGEWNPMLMKGHGQKKQFFDASSPSSSKREARTTTTQEEMLSRSITQPCPTLSPISMIDVDINDEESSKLQMKSSGQNNFDISSPSTREPGSEDGTCSVIGLRDFNVGDDCFPMEAPTTSDWECAMLEVEDALLKDEEVTSFCEIGLSYRSEELGSLTEAITMQFLNLCWESFPIYTVLKLLSHLAQEPCAANNLLPKIDFSIIPVFDAVIAQEIVDMLFTLVSSVQYGYTLSEQVQKDILIQVQKFQEDDRFGQHHNSVFGEIKFLLTQFSQ